MVNVCQGVTYIPLIAIKCGTFSKKKYPKNKDASSTWAPHAVCHRKTGSKNARWDMGPKVGSTDIWMELQWTCKKIQLPSLLNNAPPPEGCTVHKTVAECKKYKKFCAWDDRGGKVLLLDPTKITDPRICNSYPCVPWSCFGALIKPPDCGELQRSNCDDEKYPANNYWCKWKRKESECVHKGEDRDVKEYPIGIDICTTGLSYCMFIFHVFIWFLIYLRVNIYQF